MRIRDTRRWYERTQCANTDPDRYDTPAFLNGAWCAGNRNKVIAALAAGAICDTCPVLAECARDALDCETHSTIRAGIPLAHGDKSRKAVSVTQAGLEMVAARIHPTRARHLMIEMFDQRPPDNAGGGEK